MKQSKVLLALAYTLLLVACQSAPPAPAAEQPPVEAPSEPEVVPVPVPEAAPTPAVAEAPDSIQATRDGFAPAAATPSNTLRLELQWGSPQAVVSWEVAILSSDGQAVRTFRGTDTVPSLQWDGLDDAKSLPPQGRYRAVLRTAGTDGVLTDRDTSEPFLLDLIPPSGTITVTPSPFVLGAANAIVTPSPEVTLRLYLVSGGAPWTTWRLGVFHPDGRRFRDFISEEYRDNAVVWTGRALNNAQLEAGVTYRLEAEVFDVYGLKGIITATLPTTAAEAPVPVAPPTVSPVVVTLDGSVLAELPVYFAPYSSLLDVTTEDRRETNGRSLETLAVLLSRAQGTPVVVTGHANHVLWRDPVKAALEQQETLLPLSLARAEAVRAELVARGVAAAQMEVKGVGGSQPWADFDDALNREKNRRVVIELTTR